MYIPVRNRSRLIRQFICQNTEKIYVYCKLLKPHRLSVP